MTNPTTQRRLMALIVGTIYRIANGLLPVIDTIIRQPTRPWQQRARLADRFSRILQQLLALTARIRPDSLKRNPSFATTPNRTTSQTAPNQTRPSPQQPPDPTRPARLLPTRLRPARLLPARQLAQRLQNLLTQLEALAAEIGATLPATIRRHIAQARAIAGCHTLPTLARPALALPASWERAG